LSPFTSKKKEHSPREGATLGSYENEKHFDKSLPQAANVVHKPVRYETNSWGKFFEETA
jgi:hypothetical protein